MKTPKPLPRDTSEKKISPTKYRRVKDLSIPPFLQSAISFTSSLPFIYTLHRSFYSSASVEGLEAPIRGWVHFQPVFSPSLRMMIDEYTFIGFLYFWGLTHFVPVLGLFEEVLRNGDGIDAYASFEKI